MPYWLITYLLHHSTLYKYNLFHALSTIIFSATNHYIEKELTTLINQWLLQLLPSAWPPPLWNLPTQGCCHPFPVSHSYPSSSKIHLISNSTLPPLIWTAFHLPKHPHCSLAESKPTHHLPLSKQHPLNKLHKSFMSTRSMNLTAQAWLTWG